MHSQLETYLTEVSSHLGALPGKRRDEELREMRAHLEAAYAAGRGRGQAEDEAAREAFAQFGTPNAVGTETVAAWRRGRRLDRRSFWGAAVCVAILTILLTRLALLTPPGLLPTRGFGQPPFSLQIWAEWIVWLMPMFLLAGGISSLLLPRRAITGVAFGITAYLLFFLVRDMDQGRAFQDEADRIRWLIFCITDLVLVATTVAAAWAGSRWRTTRVGRMRVAR